MTAPFRIGEGWDTHQLHAGRPLILGGVTIPHIAAMCAKIAEALSLDVGAVNVKAKTAEKMGPVGEGRAIETRAVCLVQRIAER